MATYAIGDIQGCFASFERLLARIGFGPGDRLWSVGDLVNRGPGSLEVLRWMVAHDAQVTCVMGNHELHLLALAEEELRRTKGDTLGRTLKAPDREALLTWVRARPLLHREGDYLMVHAGLLPAWTEAEAEDRAREVEAALTGSDAERHALLASIYARPSAVRALAPGKPVRMRETVSVLTQLRYVDAKGGMTGGFKGPPEEAPAGMRPWYEVRRRDPVMVFGHWAALGLMVTPELIGIDSGCVWGRLLTAVRLEDRAVFAVPRAPGDQRERRGATARAAAAAAASAAAGAAVAAAEAAKTAAVAAEAAAAAVAAAAPVTGEDPAAQTTSDADSDA